MICPVGADKRMLAGRKSWAKPGDDMLILQPPSLQWGSRGTFTKDSLYTMATGKEAHHGQEDRQ